MRPLIPEDRDVVGASGRSTPVDGLGKPTSKTLAFDVRPSRRFTSQCRTARHWLRLQNHLRSNLLEQCLKKNIFLPIDGI